MVLAELLQQEKCFCGRGKSRERQRGLKRQLGRRDWDRDVAKVANLAMLFVEGLLVPVNHGMESQRAHREDEQDRQDPVLSCFRHHTREGSPPSFENIWMRARPQRSLCKLYATATIKRILTSTRLDCCNSSLLPTGQGAGA